MGTLDGARAHMGTGKGAWAHMGTSKDAWANMGASKGDQPHMGTGRVPGFIWAPAGCLGSYGHRQGCPGS